MKPMFLNPKDFEPDEARFARKPRTDEELQTLRESVISGAYVVHPLEIAGAMLAEAWLDVAQVNGQN